MTEGEIRKLVCELLGDTAPEIDFSEIDSGEAFREAFDIDSMDFLNFIAALHDATGIDIPEKDYPGLVTLDDIVGYVASRQDRK